MSDKYKREPIIYSFPAEAEEGFDPTTTSGKEKAKAIREQNIAASAPVPGESVGKEVSPSGISLRVMRKVVGNGGVQGKHVDGNNQFRPEEETIIWRETKLENQKKRP